MLAKRIQKRLKQRVLPFFLTPLSRVVEDPVFILGPAKSGTTVIAYLLGKASGKEATLDIVRSVQDPTIQFKLEYEILQFKDFVNKYRYEFSKPIIKEPFLSYFTDEIIDCFPKARFIYVVRNPFDTMRSVLNRLNIPGDLDSINFNDWPALIKTPGWRLALDSTWHGQPCGSYIDGMAKIWNIAAEGYIKHHKSFVIFKYEDFMNNKAGTIYDLMQRIDMKIVCEIESMVDIQHQPKGNRSINPIEFFGLKNYQIIKEVCGGSAKHMGYDLADI